MEKIKKQLAGLKETSDSMKVHWQQEKDIISRIRSLKEEIERAGIEAEQAERDADLAKAAELKYRKTPRN